MKSKLSIINKSLAVLIIYTAFAGAANAASNAQMTITSSVVATTCDVSVSNPNLELGNFATSALSKDLAKPAAASIKQFTVGLSNCEAPKAAGVASLKVTGATLGGNPAIFNADTNANTGIMLSQPDQADQYIQNGDVLEVATAGETPTAGDLDGKMLRLQAGLASTSATPNIGFVSAPVLFSFVYN